MPKQAPATTRLESSATLSHYRTNQRPCARAPPRGWTRRARRGAAPRRLAADARSPRAASLLRTPATATAAAQATRVHRERAASAPALPLPPTWRTANGRWKHRRPPTPQLWPLQPLQPRPPRPRTRPPRDWPPSPPHPRTRHCCRALIHPCSHPCSHPPRPSPSRRQQQRQQQRQRRLRRPQQRWTRRRCWHSHWEFQERPA
mmetsp:Transcript_20962/g.67508  ORF Transcript_20962/g.67508 Transcript_20962/m.67508 type:complete len:203 (+) Transcript_20962:1199-1807(+)